jgi:PAS domain S-box-containing protein
VVDETAIDARPSEPVAVLIVDDRHENIVALEAVLAPLNLGVVTADSGRAALRHLLTQDFAVILLDVLMPELDGFATAALIRERVKTRHIPIIFLTAVSHQDEYVARGYGLGAVDYIAKPFHPEVLRAKVAVFVELFRKNAQIRSQALLLQENERRERERALDELRRLGETRYQRLAESMPQIVWTAGADGHATYANRRWYEYTGAESGSLEPNLFESVVHLDDAAAMQSAWRGARMRGESFEIAARFRRSDGTYRWHLVRAVAIEGASGETTEWIGTSTDIDDRIRAEEGLRFLADASTALAESLEYRRTLNDVCALASRTVADWCVIDLASSAGARWLGVAGPTSAATDLARRAREDRRIRLTRFFSSEAEGPLPEGTDLDPFDGTPLTATLIVPLLVRGTEIGTLRLAHSISGRTFTDLDRALATDLARRIGVCVDNARLYEAAQSERTALEAAARTKDEFLAVLSHELRSPLHTTLGWAQMLRTGRLEARTFDMALDTIERSVRAQVRLVDDLLDVSSIVTGKLRLKIEPVDLAQIIRASVESIQPAAAAKAIALDLVLPGSGAPMRGDAARLQQVAWNLLSNAIKFTARNGHIRVVLERHEDMLRLSVSDDGDGIDPEFLPFVFDRFRQANSSTTRTYTGLGLGLSIVRHLVELHGGHCRADSAGVSRGTTMTIELPVAPTGPRLAVAAVPAETAPALEGIRVLLVDDLADGRALFQIMLEQAGARVTTVSSVAEAWRSIVDELPDILVSDIGLPGESGYDLIRRVRSASDVAVRALPAIALTAYASEADRRAALGAGFDAHVGKPIEHDALVTALRSVLAMRR